MKQNSKTLADAKVGDEVKFRFGYYTNCQDAALRNQLGWRDLQGFLLENPKSIPGYFEIRMILKEPTIVEITLEVPQLQRIEIFS